MARSVTGAFVRSVRSVLSVQLFLSIGAIAIAAWTLGITNELIRERDRLQARVIQLEEAIVAEGRTTPPPPAVVEAPAGEGEYPPSIARAAYVSAAPTDSSIASDASEANSDLGVIGSLFAPPPPLATVVLHVRNAEDEAAAQALGTELAQTSDVRVAVSVMTARDIRRSGYAYYDGRQNRAAADLMTQFHDSARRAGLAPWSAQLRGMALPSEGEYGADRLDVVLPALPPPPVTPAPVAAAAAPPR